MYRENAIEFDAIKNKIIPTVQNLFVKNSEIAI